MKIAQVGFITCFLILGWVDNAWAGFWLKEPIAIEKNNQVALLPYLSKAYKVSFDVLINSKGPTKYWESIFHLKKDRGDTYGIETPQVYLNNDGKGFYICLSRDGGLHPEDDVCYTDPINRDIGKWYHVELSQTLLYGNQYEFEAKIDDTSVFTVINTQAEQFSNVTVLTGNYWWDPIDGLIKNISIETWAVISGALLDTLNTLIQQSPERIDVQCCESGTVVSLQHCGQGTSCNTVCGVGSFDSASIVTSLEAPSSQICPRTTGISRSSFGIYGAIYHIRYCPRKVRTLEDLSRLPECCYHPVIRRVVSGVKQKCCDDYSLCV